MAFKPDGGQWNAEEETQGRRDRHEAGHLQEPGFGRHIQYENGRHRLFEPFCAYSCRSIRRYAAPRAPSAHAAAYFPDSHTKRRIL